MFSTLLTQAMGGIGRITLNRPEKLNPLSTEVLEELICAAQDFDRQAGIKVVIINGAGRGFCAGADLASFASLERGELREAADAGRRMAEAIENMRAITIAAVHGVCVGGGLVLAAACDLRIAASDTRFSIPEVDLGIPLAWGGIPRLVREIGPALTKELVLTCRTFDALEARNAGFINRVVAIGDLQTSATELAESLSSKATLTLYATKRHVNAITAQMVGTMHGWSDADGLCTAVSDPECGAARSAYLVAKGRAP